MCIRCWRPQKQEGNALVSSVERVDLDNTGIRDLSDYPRWDYIDDPEYMRDQWTSLARDTRWPEFCAVSSYGEPELWNMWTNEARTACPTLLQYSQGEWPSSPQNTCPIFFPTRRKPHSCNVIYPKVKVREKGSCLEWLFSLAEHSHYQLDWLHCFAFDDASRWHNILQRIAPNHLLLHSVD